MAAMEKNVVHGVRRLLFASRLMEVGDLEAGNEELLYAAGHVGRGLLLKNEVFPLSRPELETQLNEIGYEMLASLHCRLRTDLSSDLRFLKLCQGYIKKLLCALSKDEYRACAQQINKQRREKSHTRKQMRVP